MKDVLDQSKQVEDGLNGIVGQVQEVDKLVGEIAVACKEQSQGIQQVSVAVHEMDKVTQANAVTAEESAKNAEELHTQADSMKSALDELLGLIGGTGSKQTESNIGTTPQDLLPPSRTHSKQMSSVKPAASRIPFVSLGQ